MRLDICGLFFKCRDSNFELSKCGRIWSALSVPGCFLCGHCDEGCFGIAIKRYGVGRSVVRAVLFLRKGGDSANAACLRIFSSVSARNKYFPLWCTRRPEEFTVRKSALNRRFILRRIRRLCSDAALKLKNRASIEMASGRDLSDFIGEGESFFKGFRRLHFSKIRLYFRPAL